MHLQDLKSKSPADLLAFAEELSIENASTLRKQDMMFAILKATGRKRCCDFWAGCLRNLGRWVRFSEVTRS